jgi:methionyl-tRNA synthetase
MNFKNFSFKTSSPEPNASTSEKDPRHTPPDLETLKRQVQRPKKAVITAGMPYANGPIHLGHLAGAHVPADIYARWMRMLIGKENVVFVCGSDDHGSASEISAAREGKTTRAFIDEINARQKATMERYGISLDLYGGTSQPACASTHTKLSQDFFTSIYHNGLLKKHQTKQWYDKELGKFLQDRFVRGKCPNPKCDNEAAYSEECDRCGAHYEPGELLNPKSAFNGSTPELRDSAHWALDMWSVSDTLRKWLESKKGVWSTPLYNEVMGTVLPSLAFDKTHEPRYKEIKETLPKHKARYAPGKRVALQVSSLSDLKKTSEMLKSEGIDSENLDAWAYRDITRDVAWGIPLPENLDPEMKNKTLYVWPDSLIAPISFTNVALQKRGENPEKYKEYWTDPEARVCQFLGQDNVFFYVLMQGALWLGTQKDPHHHPKPGEYQFTEIFSSQLLQVGGQKMSKSLGNFFTGDQLILEMGYNADQIRYFLALLGLTENPSNFDFNTLKERNKFLAGPMNAAFERPLSACHSKFGGKIPEGTLNEKVKQETFKIVRMYLKSMERADYDTLLFAIENYARLVNSLFTQFKPHDDRFPEDQRKDALYSCFFVLKNILIMLHPFAPSTMENLRASLKLSESVYSVESLGTGMPAGHSVGPVGRYFPATETA